MSELGTMKKYKPTSPGVRGKVSISREGLYKGKSLSGLTEHKKKTGCRNNQGRMTVEGRSGRCQPRQRYRRMDMSGRFFGTPPGIVERIEHRGNNKAFMALISRPVGKDEDLKKLSGKVAFRKKLGVVSSYILATHGMRVGDVVNSGDDYSVDFGHGSAALLKNIPAGQEIHCIEMRPKSENHYVRSAGSSAKLVGFEGGYAIVRLPSGEVKKIHGDSRARIGRVSNVNQKHVKLGNAGSARRQGRKPTSRGIAKNPVDHPNGGRNNGGIYTNKCGNMAKGKKTRLKKHRSNKFIMKRISKQRRRR